MRHLKKPIIWIPALILVTILLMTLWVHLATTQYWGLVNLNGMNEMGDALGGTTAPFIGLLVAILTYLAFRSQIDFNKQQLKYVKDQIIESKIASLNHTFDLVVNTYRSRAPLEIDPNNLDKVIELFKESFNYKEDLISEFLSKDFNKLIPDVSKRIEARNAHNITLALTSLLFEFEMQELKDDLYEQRRPHIMHSYYAKCILLLDPNFHDLFKTYVAIFLKQYDIETSRIISKDYSDFNEINDIKKNFK